MSFLYCRAPRQAENSGCILKISNRNSYLPWLIIYSWLLLLEGCTTHSFLADHTVGPPGCFCFLVSQFSVLVEEGYYMPKAGPYICLYWNSIFSRATILPNKMPIKTFAQQEDFLPWCPVSRSSRKLPLLAYSNSNKTGSVHFLNKKKVKSQDAATCQKGRKHTFWLLRAHKTSYLKRTLFQK